MRSSKSLKAGVKPDNSPVTEKKSAVGSPAMKKSTADGTVSGNHDTMHNAESGAKTHPSGLTNGDDEEDNLDSSMGIGPVSHKSLAGSESAASAAAPVSLKSLGSFKTSGKHNQADGLKHVILCIRCKLPSFYGIAHCVCSLLTKGFCYFNIAEGMDADLLKPAGL